MAKTKTQHASTKLGSRIIADLRGLVDTLEQGAPLQQRYTVREVRQSLEPGQYAGQDVRRVRDALHVSQAIFAELLGVSVHTVQAYEQGRNEPTRTVRRLLDVIVDDPKPWLDMLKAAKNARSVA